jgi:small-conductance mechanosensitive channel
MTTEESTDIISATASQIDQFTTFGAYISSEPGLQMALIVLGVGLVIILGAYFRLSKWLKSQKIHYIRPLRSSFVQYAILPLFAIVLVTSVNVYLNTFYASNIISIDAAPEFSSRFAFAKLIDSINIIVIGWSVAQMIPIMILRSERNKKIREDFEEWKDMGGFPDEEGDLFHRLYKWCPPKTPPSGLTEEEFQNYLSSDEGIRSFENFRTPKGHPIGSYERLVENPFEDWEKSQRAKYAQYFEDCISGNNESGRKLILGRRNEEVYTISIWWEEKRRSDHSKIIAGAKPPGYAKKKEQTLPKSFVGIISPILFAVVILGVISWWGVDLFVLATAAGGLAIGVGFALQETMQNYFAYILIRKDKILIEGDRVKLDTGYNGYVHKITARVTFVRDALNESLAIIPTKSLINAQVVNYTKEEKIVPAVVEVGVSYLNNPRHVSAILVKVGRQAMKESKDDKGRHLIRQTRCPYTDEGKASCGCDKDLNVDVIQPTVRFNNFDNSSLNFTMRVYVQDYGSQYKVKTDIRIIMYEEFKKYDIRIPWPIRTVYQGDANREAGEIDTKSEVREKIVDEFGIGDIGRG